MRNAISYMRFSSKRQEKGTSIKRQQDRLDAYLARNPDIVLTDSFRDEGMSGFTGKHATSGAMGRFLAMLDNKLIETPLILIVEALDRFSREPAIDAYDRLSDLTKRGVTLVFLEEGVELSRTSLKEQPMALFQVWGQMMGAHAFSKRKSEYARGGWNRSIRLAETEGLAIKGYNGPPWTVIDPKTKRYTIGCERTVETVQQIYAWRIEGISDHGMAKLLNERGVPPVRAHVGPNHVRRGWYQSSIHRILSDRRVLGEGQFRGGPVIPNLFPRIIEPETFERAQAAKSPVPVRLGSDQGSKSIANLFTGIAHCACCGGKMTMTRNRAGPTATRFLTCDSRKRSLPCEATGMINYPALEKAVLDHLPNLPWTSIVAAEYPNDPIPGIDREIESVEHAVVEHTRERDNAKRLMLKGEEYEADFEPVYLDSRRKVIVAEARLQALQAERTRMLSAAGERPNLVNNAIEYRDAMNAVSPTERIIIREKLIATLRQMIRGLDCDTVRREVTLALSPIFSLVVVMPIRREPIVVARIEGPTGAMTLPMPKPGEAGHRFIAHQIIPLMNRTKRASRAY